MTNKPVVILGAGPAGLAAAYELIRQDISPIILEKADKIGGISRTESYKGYLFDIGGHRFLTRIKRIKQLWHKLLGDDFLKVARLSRIYYQNRFFKYPVKLTNTLYNLGIIESILILLSYLKSQIFPCRQVKSFEHWVSNRFGKRLFKTFFKTYTEKVWGIPCHEIRADWAAQRIKGLSLITAVTNALFGIHNAKTLIEEFDYPIRGPGMMWDRFQEEIKAKGGKLNLNSKVVRINCENGSIKSVTCMERNKPVDIPAGQLISSIPITDLVSLFDPKAPDKVQEAAGKLSYRSLIIVGLIVDQKDLFPDQWIYVHNPNVRVGRIQNFKNWSAAMLPDPLRTSVGMEYFCNEGDEVWTMSDTELVEIATHELFELGLIHMDDVIDSFVVHQPKAYPVYDQDYDGHIKTIKNFIEGLDNLQTIGRNGMHRYNNMDHSMQTGIFSAQNISGADHNLWDINEEDEYIEEDRQSIRERLIKQAFARMDKLAFATAVGSVSGLLFFLATIWLVIKGGDIVGPNLQLLKHYFAGYTVTVKGASIAFGYGFVWGFLLGWLFAYLRNLFLASYIYYIKKKSELVSLRDFFDHL